MHVFFTRSLFPSVIALMMLSAAPGFAQSVPSVDQSNLPGKGVARISINANGAQINGRKQCIATGGHLEDDKCTAPDSEGRFTCTKKCVGTKQVETVPTS